MSHHLAKDKPDNEKDMGVKFYRSIGWILAGCGIVSFMLLVFVSRLPQDENKYNIPLFFGIWFIISTIFLAIGVFLMILCKKSSRFQAWAEKDVASYGKHLMDRDIQKDNKKKR